MDDIIAKGSFMGCEKDADKEGATALAVAPGLGLYGELLQLYAGLHFIKEDGGLNLKTVVDYTTEVLISHGLKTSQCSKMLLVFGSILVAILIPKIMKRGK